MDNREVELKVREITHAVTGKYVTDENSPLPISRYELCSVMRNLSAIYNIQFHKNYFIWDNIAMGSIFPATISLKTLVRHTYIMVSQILALDTPVNNRNLCYVGIGPLPIIHHDETSNRFTYPDIIKYADYNRLPTGFEFRNLQRDTLYVMHPLDDKVYVPFEGSDVFFLQERIRDFIMFSAALGAKRVRATAKVKHSEVSRSTSDTSASGSAGFKKFGASGSYNSSSSNYESLAMSSAFNFEREFEGIARPEVLDKLPWYKHESSWHQIQQERELFGTKRLMESISTSTTRIVNSSNIEKIKGDVKILFAKASASYEKAVTQMLETQDDLIETIEVEF